MIKWFIDKTNKVPLYLQLRDLIKYYISTGAIQDNHQLPGVNKLAQELGINFETVRKAYKELEKEGLISMHRARGTFATLHKAVVPKAGLKNVELDLYDAIKISINKLFQNGKTSEEIKKIIDQALEEVSSERIKQFIIFTECNPLQVNEISNLLENYLKINVKPVLLEQLKEEIQKIPFEEKKLRAIVTTGFHVNDVRKIIGDIPVVIHILITNMAPETRRQLDVYGKDARFGFICRDQESIPLYKDLLKAEFGKEMKLSTSVLGDQQKVEAMINSVDVLLVTPPVYKAAKEKAAKSLPVFNVFDRVDPMSLRVLKDRILQEAR